MKKRSKKTDNILIIMLRKRILWILFGLALLGTLLLIAMPLGLDYGIERYFLSHGADQMDMEDVDFNPFTRRLVLKNLNIKVGKENVLNVSEAGFTFAWSSFFKKRFLIEKIDLSNSFIAIEELPDGHWRIGGLSATPSEDKSTASSWGFGLIELQVQNSSVKFRSAQLTSELSVEQARLTRLRTWRPEQKTRLELKGRLNGGLLKFQGDLSLLGEDTAVDGTLKVQGLTLSPFALLVADDAADLQGRLDADVRIQSQYGSEKGFSFDLTGRLVLKEARMRFGDVDLADDEIVWNGTWLVKMPKASDELIIRAAGELKGEDGSLNPPVEKLGFRHSGLNWNGKFVLTAKPKAVDFTVDGELKLLVFNMVTADLNLAEENLSWNGILKFLLPENSENHRLTTKGKLESKRQKLSLLRENLNLTNENLSWQGQFNCGLKDFRAGLAAEGDFSATILAITDTQKKLRLLKSKTINLTSITGDADTQFGVAAVKITGLDLVGEVGPPKKTSLFSAAEVLIDTIRLDQLKKLSIDSARITNAKGWLHRKSDGSWMHMNALKASPALSGTAPHKMPSQKRGTNRNGLSETKADGKFGIRIGSLQIVGDSALHVEDETVSPAFRSEVRLKEARLTGVNSLNPEQPSLFSVEASSRKYTRMELQGKVRPFGERISMDLNGKIKALEMPPLSPYAVKTLGYNLISGEIDADIELKIVVGQIEGEGDLKFHKPEVEAVNPEKLENMEGSPIPLQSALKVLRDKNGDVRLKVPISGDVADPKFSFSDAINQAVVKGLRMATLSYLKYMLGPYGTAIGIMEIGLKVGKKVLPGIRLNPIEFQPGASEPDMMVPEYVEKVAAIMREKKDLRLRLCGWATQSDRMGQRDAAKTAPAAAGSETLQRESAPGRQTDAPQKARIPLSDEAMLVLAEQRADHIETILVNQHHIKDERIFICKPEIDKNPDAKPRVELVF
ncbi:MAG: DUF748 domain-containing protein [Desulfobacterales bacterium]|jgi:hypothetical protein